MGPADSLPAVRPILFGVVQVLFDFTGGRVMWTTNFKLRGGGEFFFESRHRWPLMCLKKSSIRSNSYYTAAVYLYIETVVVRLCYIVLYITSQG